MLARSPMISNVTFVKIFLFQRIKSILFFLKYVTKGVNQAECVHFLPRLQWRFYWRVDFLMQQACSAVSWDVHTSSLSASWSSGCSASDPGFCWEQIMAQIIWIHTGGRSTWPVWDPGFTLSFPAAGPLCSGCLSLSPSLLFSLRMRGLPFKSPKRRFSSPSINNPVILQDLLWIMIVMAEPEKNCWTHLLTAIGKDMPCQISK